VYYCYNAAGVDCSSEQFFREQLATVTLNLEGIHVVSIVLCLFVYLLRFQDSGVIYTWVELVRFTMEQCTQLQSLKSACVVAVTLHS